jgi:hypothetical protein
VWCGTRYSKKERKGKIPRHDDDTRSSLTKEKEEKKRHKRKGVDGMKQVRNGKEERKRWEADVRRGAR